MIRQPQRRRRCPQPVHHALSSATLARSLSTHLPHPRCLHATYVSKSTLHVLSHALSLPARPFVCRSFIHCSLCTTSFIHLLSGIDTLLPPDEITRLQILHIRSQESALVHPELPRVDLCFLHCGVLPLAYLQTAACDGALRSLLRILSLAILSLVALPFLMLAAGIVSSD